MSKTHNPLVNKLFSELKKRGVSVPEFELQTKIPKDRVYKWKQQGTSPKADDERIIMDWINGENVENVPHENVPASEMQALIKSNADLAESNKSLAASHARLVSMLEVKSTAYSPAETSQDQLARIEALLNKLHPHILNHLKVMIQLDAERDAGGDQELAKRKLNDVGKRLLKGLGLTPETDKAGRK